MNIFVLLAVFLVLVFVVIASPAFAKTLVVASEFKGQLVHDGDKPAADQALVRRWENAWTGKSGEQKTTTDEGGYFSFPKEVVKSFSAGFLPHAPSTVHKVYAVYPDGTEKEFWSLDKSSYEENSEFKLIAKDRQSYDVVCQLDKTWEDLKNEDGILYVSSCRFKD